MQLPSQEGVHHEAGLLMQIENTELTKLIQSEWPAKFPIAGDGKFIGASRRWEKQGVPILLPAMSQQPL